MQRSDLDGRRVFPLFALESDQISKTLSWLEGYWKAQSIVYLGELGLPTLPAIAVTEWNNEIQNYLMKFFKERNWKSVVIRTDKASETGKGVPRGGYLVEINNLENEVKQFLELGRLVMLLEPRDKYTNLYGINVSYNNNSPDELYLEIVGPGFEVSNLNRGDVSPHERLRIKRKSEGVDIIERSVTSLSEYKKSVYYRLLHLGEFLVSKQKKEAKSETELVEIAKTFLKENGYDLLFKHEDSYSEIPKSFLKKIKDFISPLPQKMTKLGLDIDEFVVSSTIFNNEELVFWDIVWPTRKYRD